MAMQICCKLEAAHDYPILCLAYNVARREVFTGSQDGLIKVWDAANGGLIRRHDRHRGWVTDLVFAQDPKLLFSASLDHTVLVWSEKGQELQEVVFSGAVHCLGWATSRSVLVVGCNSELFFYSVNESDAGRLARSRRAQASGAVAAMPAAKVSMKGVRVLQLLTQPFRPPDTHDDIIRAIACAENGLVFTVGSDRAMCIYEVPMSAWVEAKGQARQLDRPRVVKKIPEAHTAGLVSASVDSHNGWVLTGGIDGTCRIWSAEGYCLEEFKGMNELAAWACYVPQTRHYWITSRGDRISALDSRGPTHLTDCLRTVSELDSHAVVSLRQPPGTDCVLATTKTRQVLVWRYNPAAAYRTFDAGEGWVECLTVVPDHLGTSHVYAGGSQGALQHWAVCKDRSGVEVYTMQDEAQVHQGSILCLAYSPELDAVITGSEDHTIRVRWTNLREQDKSSVASAMKSLEKDDHVRTVDGPKKALSAAMMAAMAFRGTLPAATMRRPSSGASSTSNTRPSSPNLMTETLKPQTVGGGGGESEWTTRRKSAVSGGVHDQQMKIHGLERKPSIPKQRLSLAGWSQPTISAYDGLMGGTIMLAPSPTKWVDGTEITMDVVFTHDARVTGLAVLEDWVLASCSHDRSLRLWDLHLMKPLRSCLEAHDSPIQCLAYARERGQLATSSMDATVRVWDSVSLELLYTLDGHTEEVSQVAWVSWKQQWVTAGDDDTLRLWDTKGREVRQIGYKGGSVNALHTDPVNRLLLAAMQDRTVRLYNLSGPASKLGSPAPPPGPSDDLPVCKFAGHSDLVRGIGFIPEKGVYVTGAWDKTLRLWFKPPAHGNRLTRVPTAIWGSHQAPQVMEEPTSCLPPLEKPRALQQSRQDAIRNMLTRITKTPSPKVVVQEYEPDDHAGLGSRLSELESRLVALPTPPPTTPPAGKGAANGRKRASVLSHAHSKKVSVFQTLPRTRTLPSPPPRHK